MLQHYRYLIIGAGAVGQAIVSFLKQAGMSLTVLARGETASALRQHGIQRTGLLGNYLVESRNLDVKEKINDLKNEAFDAIFICVKSFDSEVIANELKRYPNLIKEPTVVVLCQNGWGNAEVFATIIERCRLLNARILTGFRRAKINEVNVTVHARPIRIGSLFSRDTSLSESVCAVLSRGGLPTEATAYIEQDLWEKMCFNCTVNPLGAIFGVPLGELVICPEMRLIIERMIGEIFDVIYGCGFRTNWPNAKSYLRFFYEELIPATASHPSSMLQDILSG